MRSPIQPYWAPAEHWVDTSPSPGSSPNIALAPEELISQEKYSQLVSQLTDKLYSEAGATPDHSIHTDPTLTHVATFISPSRPSFLNGGDVILRQRSRLDNATGRVVRLPRDRSMRIEGHASGDGEKWLQVTFIDTSVDIRSPSPRTMQGRILEQPLLTLKLPVGRAPSEAQVVWNSNYGDQQTQQGITRADLDGLNYAPAANSERYIPYARLPEVLRARTGRFGRAMIRLFRWDSQHEMPGAYGVASSIARSERIERRRHSKRR